MWNYATWIQIALSFIIWIKYIVLIQYELKLKMFIKTLEIMLKKRWLIGWLGKVIGLMKDKLDRKSLPHLDQKNTLN